jgi:DNA-binding IclR family transcriptional regulator
MAEIQQRLRAAGGTVEGSQGSIAKLLELPKTTAHRMLHSLAVAGAIQLATGPTGTRVALV